MKNLGIVAIVQQSIWLIGKLNCVVTNRQETDAFEFCQPVEDDPAWKLLTYWWMVRAYRIYIATCYFFYLELFLYVFIGSIQISSMGDLAIQLSASMRGLYSRDESRLCTNLYKIEPKYHRITAFLISYILIGFAFAFCIDGFIFLANFDEYNLIDSEGNLRIDDLNKARHESWILAILWMLSFLLLIYYLIMRYMMNKYFSGGLASKKR